MRKIVVEMDPAFVRRLGRVAEFLDGVESIEGRAILRFDPIQGIKIVIADLYLKPGMTLDKLRFPPEGTLLDVLEHRGNRYTVVMKGEVRRKRSLMRLFSMFDLDVIWDTPWSYTRDRLVLSFLAEGENVAKGLRALKALGAVRDVQFHKATYAYANLLGALTDKQREVLVADKRLGYYDVPRRVRAEDVADKLGVSKATAAEHLRKAERRIMGEILAGY